MIAGKKQIIRGMKRKRKGREERILLNRFFNPPDVGQVDSQDTPGAETYDRPIGDFQSILTKTLNAERVRKDVRTQPRNDGIHKDIWRPFLLYTSSSYDIRRRRSGFH